MAAPSLLAAAFIAARAPASCFFSLFPSTRAGLPQEYDGDQITSANPGPSGGSGDTAATQRSHNGPCRRHAAVRPLHIIPSEPGQIKTQAGLGCWLTAEDLYVFAIPWAIDRGQSFTRSPAAHPLLCSN